MYDGKSTTNPQEAGKLMQGVVESRLENIVKGAITLDSKAEIANVGWCFGGSWSKISLIGRKTNHRFCNVLWNACKRC
jgi:carboxymethylenebutenolidase